MLNYYTEPNCKYRLPCGWCDRKNQQCTQVEYNTHPLVVNDFDPKTLWRNVHIPEACRTCSSHPSNGGSGLCSCSLAYPNINSYTIQGSVNATAPSASVTGALTCENSKVTITKDNINKLATQTKGEVNNA